MYTPRLCPINKVLHALSIAYMVAALSNPRPSPAMQRHATPAYQRSSTKSTTKRMASRPAPRQDEHQELRAYLKKITNSLERFPRNLQQLVARSEQLSVIVKTLRDKAREGSGDESELINSALYKIYDYMSILRRLQRRFEHEAMNSEPQNPDTPNEEPKPPTGVVISSREL